MAKWDNVQHGNPATYRSTEYACRCDACREANTELSRKERAARRKRGLPEGDPRHGTLTGYTNWGCNCDLCRAAGSQHNKDAYAAKKAAEQGTLNVAQGG